jgi:signal transduction histidine kinase
MVLENSFYERLGDASSAADDIRKLISVLTIHKIALWEYDIPTGVCFFSVDYFKILGLDKLGIFFTTIEESYAFIHPDDLPRYKNFFERLLRTHTQSAKLSYRHISPKGDCVWMEDHFLFYGKNGTPDEIIVYSVDVTKRREKELQLIKVTEYNKKVLDAMPEFMFIFDDDFHIVDILKSSRTELLHSTDELKGVNARHIYSPEVSDLFIENIHECLYTQSLREIQYPLEKEGQTYYFEARLSPFGDGKVLALIRDIGERVRRNNDLMEAKRKAEEADRMKNVFLASMSHEIRTPLNAIVGFSEILLMDDVGEEREEYLSIIRRNSELLLRLIDDILDLSRIEAGKEEMVFHQTDLNKLIEQIGVSTEVKVPGHLQFDVLLPSEDIQIYTDQNRLTQILTNFLSNSLKNTTEGGITLGLTREGDMIKVYVSDTGIGIPKEKQELIFHRFEKLDDFKQGTGLGLSICKHLSERLGGRIALESEPGKGSTFSLYLHESSNGYKNENGYLRAKRRILLVEDSETDYLKLKDVLSKDYSLMRAINARDTVRAVLAAKPNLLIINMGLMHNSAFAIIEQVRNIYPELLIIAIIESGHYSLRQRAFQAGCSEIIIKPYAADRLCSVVNALMGG